MLLENIFYNIRSYKILKLCKGFEMDNIFFLTLQFFVIIAFGMFWYKLLRWDPEESICMAIISAMTMVFVFAYFGKGIIALAVIYICSGLGFLWFFLGSKIKWFAVDQRRAYGFFSPSVILLTVVFLYGTVAFNGLHINNWDEMHQWGKSVTFMLHQDMLPMGEEFDGAEILLSSTTVFHYFFCKLPKVLSGRIVESNMYVSNLVLWFAAAMLPLSGMSWKQWKQCLAYAVTVFLAMNILFIQPYYNIYCDQPVTIWTGALIAWILFCREKKYRSVFVVLSLMNISLMKSMMGPLFVCILVLTLFIKYFMEFGLSFKETIIAVWKHLTLRKISYSMLCMVSVFLFSTLWSFKIGKNAVMWSDTSNQAGENRFILTLKSGLMKWFEPVNGSAVFPNMTFFLYLLIVVLVAYWFSRRYLQGKLRAQYSVLMGIYSFGFLCFFSLMIYAYMTTFTYADSIVTGSLNRYMSDFMLIGLIPTILPAFRSNIEDSVNVGKISFGATVLLLFFALSTTNGFINKVSKIQITSSNSYKQRLELENSRDEILKLMDSDERIYMINQTSNGYYTVAADYVFEHLIDRSGMCYYFTKDENNIAGLSKANFRALPKILLQNFGYLWIYKTDSYFDKMAFDVLKIPNPKEGDFYKVVNEKGRLKLKLLGNIAEKLDGKVE